MRIRAVHDDVDNDRASDGIGNFVGHGVRQRGTQPGRDNGAQEGDAENAAQRPLQIEHPGGHAGTAIIDLGHSKMQQRCGAAAGSRAKDRQANKGHWMRVVHRDRENRQPDEHGRQARQHRELRTPFVDRPTRQQTRHPESRGDRQHHQTRVQRR